MTASHDDRQCSRRTAPSCFRDSAGTAGRGGQGASGRSDSWPSRRPPAVGRETFPTRQLASDRAITRPQKLVVRGNPTLRTKSETHRWEPGPAVCEVKLESLRLAQPGASRKKKAISGTPLAIFPLAQLPERSPVLHVQRGKPLTPLKPPSRPLMVQVRPNNASRRSAGDAMDFDPDVQRLDGAAIPELLGRRTQSRRGGGAHVALRQGDAIAAPGLGADGGVPN